MKLTYTGKPRPATFSLPAPYEAHCATLQAANGALAVDAKEAVDGAVAWLSDVTEGEAPPEDPVVQDEKACAYIPHVMAAAVTQPIRLTDSDPGNHMVRIDFLGEPHLDDLTKVLASGGGVILQAKPEWAGRIGRVTCPIHLWMSGWMLFFDHPYFAVTDGGVADIRKVPPGNHQLVVWHEGIDATFDGNELKTSDPSRVEIPIDVGKTDVTVALTLGDDGTLARAK